jgi:ADP-heptose:LPS heptosyltransferase
MVLQNRLNHQGRAWRFARFFAERHDVTKGFASHVKDYVGKLSLEDTAALINQAGLVVGNDCGLTHLAVALGKTVFLLLGPSSSRKNWPGFLGNVHIISKGYPCQPCQEKPHLKVWQENGAQAFCPYHFRCMDDLSVDMVLSAVRDIGFADV